jgi:methionyl-tRNA formyltransferase
MKSLNIAYFGTPYFSAHLLEKILTDPSTKQLVGIKFVVTRPDKPVGRRQILTPSPVKQIALRYKIPVIENLKTFHVSRNTLHKLDFAFLYAYGGIVPNESLHLPRLGFLNTHPSLLPKYRGPSPITYPLILGDKETGVTLIQLDERIDHGPILAREKIEILSTDRRPDLEIKLTDLAFNMFKRLVNELALSGVEGLKFKEQNHKKATFTKILEKKDGFIPFDTLRKEIKKSSQKIYNLFRGLYPWPGIWTLLPNGKRLKITSLTMKQFNHLTIESVQLEGKNEVDFKTFNSAYKVFTP